jgi:hypothetical protein
MNKRKTLKRNIIRKNKKSLKRNGTRKNKKSLKRNGTKKTLKRKKMKNKLGGAFPIFKPYYVIVDEHILGEVLGKLAVQDNTYIVQLLEESENYKPKLIDDDKYGQILLLTGDKMRIVTEDDLTEERKNLIKKINNTRQNLVEE